MNKEAADNVIALMSVLKSKTNNAPLTKEALRALPTAILGGGGVLFALAKIEEAKRKSAEQAQKEMMGTWGPFIQGLIGQRGNIGYQEAIQRMG